MTGGPKAVVAPLRAALAEATAEGVRAALRAVLAPGAPVRLAHPFGTVEGGEAAFAAAFAPLLAAWPDLERREFLLIAGEDGAGAVWVGAAGHYLGTFVAPFLGIPPTGHLVHMRFHEFFRVEGDRVAEVQALWDIPEVMMQAAAWPMAPQLGRFLMAPGPAGGGGLAVAGDGAAARDLVLAMLAAMVRHPVEPVAAMELPRFWHPRCLWHGPAGIGSARGIAGFRAWHQIPFLAAMPDRGQDRTGTEAHFFAEGDFVAVTGWPNMRQTLTGGGWLGLPATGRVVTLRSLDFWRVEAGQVRENWVLVDLLDAFAQAGVDVMARMAEMTRVRSLAPVPLPAALGVTA